MGEKPKEVVTKALTPRAIALAVILILIGMVINLLCWTGAGITMEPFFAGRLGVPIYPPYGLVFLLAMVAALTAGRVITPAEAALVSAMLFITLDYPYIVQAFCEPFIATAGVPYILGKYKDLIEPLYKFLPKYWSPIDNPEILRGAYEGGAAVPWGALAPYIGFWTLVMTTFLLCQLFLGALAKYILVDVEKLPFPNIIPAATLIRMGESRETFVSKAKRPQFLIPFIIGFIVGILCSANYWKKYFPLFYAWGQIHVSSLDAFFKKINPSIQGWFIFVPVDLAICYLMPLDVLITGLLWVIVIMIIYPIIATKAGWVEPGQNPAWRGPFQYGIFSLWGVPLGLAIGLLLFRGKSLVERLRAAKTEAGEIPPMLLIGGFIVFSLIYLAIWIYVGAPAVLAVLFIIIWYLFTLGHAKYVGETGYWPGWYNIEYFSRPFLFRVGSGLGIFTSNPCPTKACWATMAMACVGTTHTAPQAPCYAWGIASSFKLGAEAGVRPREMFFGLLIASLVVGILGIPIALKLFYHFGLKTKLTSNWWLCSASHIRWHQRSYSMYKATPLGGARAYAVAAGIIVTVILMFLRMKFPWFIINPAALLFYDIGIWFLHLLIALVLKYITIKVFGAKFYEEVGVPIAVAYIAGAALAAFIGGTVFTLYKISA